MAKNAKKPASARKGSARRPAKSGNKRNNRSAGRRWFSWRFIAKVSVVLLVLAYWFNKLQLNLAGLSIGIDFAQIVAMFAAFDFAWPVALRRSLNSVSASNFNLQILAPECSVTWSFKQRFYITQSIPVLMFVSLGVMGGVIYVDYVNFTPKTKPWSARQDAAYQSFGRLGFALAVAVVSFYMHVRFLRIIQLTKTTFKINYHWFQ